MRIRNICSQVLGVLIFAASADVSAQTPAEHRHLFWGDTHLHTENSVDAFENGNTNADLDTAYRFARGFPVLHPSTGHRIRIDRPLDFLVVADHAEMLSLQRLISEGNEKVLSTAAGKRLAKLYESSPLAIFRQVLALSIRNENRDILTQLHVPGIRKNTWEYQIDKAEENNTPGVFTAFIGWEWSPSPGGQNLHRVVFTSGSADQVRNILPLSNFDTVKPEELWSYLQQTETDTGANFLAIPHNSNVSGGAMFPLLQSDGTSIDEAYAATRMRWEPVIEITQTKGTSETHPQLSKSDEFADFEIRKTLLSGAKAPVVAGAFARTALLRGLTIENQIGVNPYRFGFVGSTDSHTGLVSVEENNFYGKSGMDFLPESRAKKGKIFSEMSAWQVSAGGLAAVWAEQNTRESIFNAFKRKEVYATTGPRIQLRVFGGFAFKKRDAQSSDIAAVGYAKGVPMGGTLIRSKRSKSLSLLIDAVKDPLEADLERVQVIKGWLDKKGKAHEKIYDVAVTGVKQKHKTSNFRASEWIGEARFSVIWSDPDFDATQSAFYYVRVLQVPTLRHHVYDLLALGKDPAGYNKPSTIRERAYSSPIWYRSEAN